MKKILFVITLIGILQGCLKDDSSSNIEMQSPISMTVLCMNAPNDTVSQTDYEYESENLIKVTVLSNKEIYSVTNFEYNSQNLIIKETRDQYSSKTEITYIYNKSKQLTNKLYKNSEFDPNGVLLRTTEYETTLEYQNDLLIKDVETWGGWNTYEYSNGKLTTKNVFTKTGQLYWILKFKYSGGLKVEEKNQTAGGNIIYTKIFEYDSERRLVKVIEDGNIVEQNIYDTNKLVEKRIFYFGIDPGFSACNGNFIYKYQYQ